MRDLGRLENSYINQSGYKRLKIPMENVVNKLNEICNTLGQLEDHLLTVSSLPNVTSSSSSSPEQKLLLDAVILLGSITRDWNKQCSDNMQSNSNSNPAYKFQEIHTMLYDTVTDIDKVR